MRLVRTRGMLSTLIMKYRKSEKGTTITDGDFKRTYKELKMFERWYSIYKVIAIILTILICCYVSFLIAS